MVNEKGIDNLFLLLKLFKMQERYKNVVKKNDVSTYAFGRPPSPCTFSYAFGLSSSPLRAYILFEWPLMEETKML